MKILLKKFILKNKKQKDNIKKNSLYYKILFLVILLIITLILNFNFFNQTIENSKLNIEQKIPEETIELLLNEKPTKELYKIINKNIPYFDKKSIKNRYKIFSNLDNLKRVGQADAILGIDDLPTKKRENISHVIPTGWKQARYDIIEDRCLYNRCHLIAFQLSGENDNKLNLMTGTTSFNNKGMLPFENMTKDYIKISKKKVRYRVTPLFYKDDLVARGVIMEAYSIEDNGISLCFNVFVYNTQPNIEIDYKDGSSKKIK